MRDPAQKDAISALGEVLSRRAWLVGTAAVAAGLWLLHDSSTSVHATTFEVTKTDAEWRRLLTPAAYNVLRQEGTEPPFSSPLDHETRKGKYLCAGCDLPLFSSDTKFDSGTGWPSFYRPLPDAVETSSDRSLIVPRTEVHCHRCGGHLGHVFEDGPPPTGLRYCMNGVALRFLPSPA